MLTKLEKALGLVRSSEQCVEPDYLILALKGKCAGDTYYFNMAQSSFDSAMEGDEDEAFYRMQDKE